MKDFGAALIFGTALFLALKYALHLHKANINHIAVLEWFGRGFFFAIGLMTATLTIILFMRLVMEMVK